MKKFLIFLCFLLSDANALHATDLVIENIRLIHRPDILSTPVSVSFDIRWKNAWKNDRNHDAVWVFMKYGGYWNNQVRLANTGHSVIQNRLGTEATPEIKVSEDGMGFFIYPQQKYRGDINCKVQIRIDTTGRQLNRRQIRGFRVHGVEMVYIPQGSFSLGSPDEEAIRRAAFYQSNAQGTAKGLISIQSEAAIQVAPEDGALYYWSESELYNGDQQGPIPAEFPKGFQAFYLMKYELTQGQYADFLNALPDGWTAERSPIGARSYYKKRGGIRLEGDRYVADNPQRPMNQLGFMDALAYTDWAALRPITELEYEKACRGPGDPLSSEFPWGTSDYQGLERYVVGQELVLQNGYDESQLTDATRPIFGASYYWVMDLSGSVWEKVITIGNPVGRAFMGTHGDGILKFAKATNADWPQSDDELGGFGYRGGGYYEPGTEYGDFNPHSPIGYRYYGAWSGGPRSIAYGYRAGRTE